MPTTEWKLLGIYKQDFYEFFEQVSKHLWYYDDYEYIVACAGLSYIIDGCESLGNNLYGGPRPLQGGSFEMGLYTDSNCLIDYEGGETYDQISGHYYANAEKFADDDYYKKSNAETNTKEYTMTLFNEVFDEFKYCTLCIDYPT